MLKQDREGFVLPKSVQDTIPIRRLWPDGIFQFGSKFSKAICSTDISYAIASKKDRLDAVLPTVSLCAACMVAFSRRWIWYEKRCIGEAYRIFLTYPTTGH